MRILMKLRALLPNKSRNTFDRKSIFNTDKENFISFYQKDISKYFATNFAKQQIETLLLVLISMSRNFTFHRIDIRTFVRQRIQIYVVRIFSHVELAREQFLCRKGHIVLFILYCLHILLSSHLYKKEGKERSTIEERVPRLELGLWFSCKNSRVTYCFVKCRSPI